MTDSQLQSAEAGSLRLQTAVTAGTQWLTHLQLWQPEDVDTIETGEHETAVILLRGTFDLMAGTTSWPARGARQSEFQGRPMAVFLPPNTPFRVGGSGEILMVAARQPIVEEAVGKEALSAKPLLPLAGSGKSFDPSTGEWKPAETFATAAESLPPRRFQKLQAGDVKIERIFAEDYKAATLSLDEAIVPAGASLRVGEIPSLPACDEVLIFTRSEGEPDSTRWFPLAEARDQTIDAGATATYTVIAYAGK